MKKTLGIFGMLLSTSTLAGGYCTEKITQLIIDSGHISFKSSKTCDGWCRINSAWSEAQKDRAFSMLLAARAQDKSIQMYWAQLETTCEKKLEPHSSPSAIYF